MLFLKSAWTTLKCILPVGFVGVYVARSLKCIAMHMKYALNTNFMVREFHMRLHLCILVFWKWSCYMEVIFITIRNITMTFLCKFILIQTNNCEYEVLNVKCQFCFYRKLPNNWSFFFTSLCFLWQLSN